MHGRDPCHDGSADHLVGSQETSEFLLGFAQRCLVVRLARTFRPADEHVVERWEDELPRGAAVHEDASRCVSHQDEHAPARMVETVRPSLVSNRVSTGWRGAGWHEELPRFYRT
jgi:hypothetical protein